MALLAAGAMVTTLTVSPGQAVAHHDWSGEIYTTIEVVAEGLDTPRGVFYDRDNHRVLVAEAGDAAENNGPCAAGANSQLWCVGRSGAIFEYSELGGASGRIVTGLASIRTPDNLNILGAHDVVLRNGVMHLVFGLSGRDTFRNNLGPDGADLATVGTIDASGDYVPYADLIAFEMANNPDGRRFDSDAWGMSMTDQGTFVGDAGGNSVLRVTQGSPISLIVSPPPRLYNGDPDYESVPTDVVLGPDGAFYISELTGFPYHQGSARVLRFEPGVGLTVHAAGFTNITSLDWDERGRLIVLQISKDGLFLPPDTVTGRLVRIECDGTQTELATVGLENPGAVAVAGPGEFYITNRATSAGNVGQLLRVRTHGHQGPQCN